MPKRSHAIEIAVTPEHLDILEHVNNVVYLGWVQDVAIAHWDVLAPAEVRAAMYWVVTRHEIDYLRSAVLGDTVVVTTWLGAEVDGLFERFTRMTRTADGKELVHVRTLWCPMDMRTGRRIRHVPEHVRALL